MVEGLVGRLLGSYLSNFSSNNFYSHQFNIQRESKETISLRFNSSNLESYNSKITLNEFKSALQKCSDTSPGNYNFHYIMLKKLARAVTVSCCISLISPSPTRSEGGTLSEPRHPSFYFRP